MNVDLTTAIKSVSTSITFEETINAEKRMGTSLNNSHTLFLFVRNRQKNKTNEEEGIKEEAKTNQINKK